MHPCELCNAHATVFCPPDRAFLCSDCDRQVHHANFLAARHLRRPLCNTFISALLLRPYAVACSFCPSTHDDDLHSTSSSTSPAKQNSGGRRTDSSSTITSVKGRRMSSKAQVNNLKAGGILVNWCGKLGVETDSVSGAGLRVLRVCVKQWPALPFRVCLAASMWFGLRFSLGKSALTSEVLKRLEEIAGVPAKIITAAQSKLEIAVKKEEMEHCRRRLGLEEGWAES